MLRNVKIYTLFCCCLVPRAFRYCFDHVRYSYARVGEIFRRRVRQLEGIVDTPKARWFFYIFSVISFFFGSPGPPDTSPCLEILAQYPTKGGFWDTVLSFFVGPSIVSPCVQKAAQYFAYCGLMIQTVLTARRAKRWNKQANQRFTRYRTAIRRLEARVAAAGIPPPANFDPGAESDIDLEEGHEHVP